MITIPEAALAEAQRQHRELMALRRKLDSLRAIVDEQAQDAGLWAVPPVGEQRISEALLQRELRRLHAAIEMPG